MSGLYISSWETLELRFPGGPIIIKRDRNNPSDYSIAIPPEGLDEIKKLRAEHANYANLNLAEFLIKLFAEDEVAEPT